MKKKPNVNALINGVRVRMTKKQTILILPPGMDGHKLKEWKRLALTANFTKENNYQL